MSSILIISNRFLASGKYSNHPRINEVSAWALDLSNQRKTAQVIANLKCFSCVLRQKKIQARDYQRISQEKRDVKFVGTEIEISYDLVSWKWFLFSFLFVSCSILFFSIELDSRNWILISVMVKPANLPIPPVFPESISKSWRLP